jgi:isoleucyl-tRNA synthetase
MFKKVNPKQNFPEMEKDILKFWQENKIFEKSVEQKGDEKTYSFFDGPPFATGLPHYGHMVANLIKDVVPRYWTMRGYKVERRWGWDCHGLPIENLIEKEHNIENKQDIEKWGVDKFNDACHASVLRYADKWKKFIPRMGRWVDMENDYRTMDWKYTESIWWVFSELYKKGLVYEGYKAMHICPRCETTLSNFEVTQGYKEITDLSATVKFKLKYPAGKTGRGAGALIYNDKNEVLLLRRNENGRRKTWAMPGGKVDGNETFREALEREVDEELGVKIESAEPFVAKPDILEGRLFETVCFKVKIKGEPNIMEKNKIDKLEWFSLDNLPEVDYPPSRDALEVYKQNQKSFHIEIDMSKPLVNVYALAWTTTPWTLPGNVALAVGEDIEYIMVKFENDFYVLAKDRVKDIFTDKQYEVLNNFKGKELVGLGYEPLFDYYVKTGGPTSIPEVQPPNSENGWKIYAGDFVTTEEGTGIVHIAPAFGDDDMKMGQKYNLPFVQHVKMNGRFADEVVDFRENKVDSQIGSTARSLSRAAIREDYGTNGEGREVKPKRNPRETDEKIVKWLEDKDKLFSKENYKHSYPHCWRCDTPLLNYATSSWFVKVTEIKDKMIKNNQEIKWVPGYIKDGRFGKWLEDARDWAVSRSRFWGAPLPIWRCGECKNIEVISSVEELKKKALQEIGEINLHKPNIDKIKIKCQKCGGEASIVGNVFDCWFESGSMPYAQWHYPFENKDKFEKGFPAEFIAEGLDQTRGWFYTLIVLSSALFDKPAFKNVIVNGIVLAEDGQKMSKRLKNYPEPNLLIEKYGADSLRYYLLTSLVMKAENLRFSERGVDEVLKRFVLTLWNAYSFLVMNAGTLKLPLSRGQSNNLLDKWIISEFNILVGEVNKQMKNYDLAKASRPLREFVDKLSNWYVRRSRKRFIGAENMDDRNNASITLYYVLTEYSKLIAPFMPFLAEEIYKNLTGRESVHLENYPVANKDLIDEKVSDEMNFVRDVVTLGLAIRAKNSLKVRQPLSELRIMNYESRITEELLDLIKDELNVKEVEFVESSQIGSTQENGASEGWAIEESAGIKVALNLNITDELRAEGFAREIVRHIQAMRKEAKYNRDDMISVKYNFIEGEEEVKKVFEVWGSYIKKECLVWEIVFCEELDKDGFDLVKKLKTGNMKLEIGIIKR